MLGVEEQVMRRTFLYAAMTRDDDDNADGFFFSDLKLNTKENVDAFQL